MSVSARYNRLLIASSIGYLSIARERRIASRSALASMKLAAGEFGAADMEDESVPQNDPVTIPQDMVSELVDARGFTEEEVSRHSYSWARDILEHDLHAKDYADQDAKVSEGTKDIGKLSEEIQSKSLSTLALMEQALAKTEAAYDSIFDQLEKLGEDKIAAEAANNQSALSLITKKTKMLEGHIRIRAEAKHKLKHSIDAYKRMSLHVSNIEDKLITQLHEVDPDKSTAPVHTMALTDSILQSTKEKLKEISDIKDQYTSIQKEIIKQDRIVEILLKKQTKLKPGDMAGKRQIQDRLSTVRDTIDDLHRDQKSLTVDLLRAENSLLDVQVERKLKEIKDALQGDIHSVPEADKPDVAIEPSPSAPVQSKTEVNKQQAAAMKGLVTTLEQKYGDFVVHYLGPSLPADPKVDNYIKEVNSSILETCEKIYTKANTYSRNEKYRSAIILPGVLYEVLAANMNAALDNPQEAVPDSAVHEANVVIAELLEAGYLSAAVDLKWLLEQGKALVDTGKKALDTGKRVIDKGTKTIKELQHSYKVRNAPEHPQRNPEASQDVLNELFLAQQDLRQKLKLTQDTVARMRRMIQENPPSEKQRGKVIQNLVKLEESIPKLESEIRELSERKDILTKSLAKSHSTVPLQDPATGTRISPDTSDQAQAALMFKQHEEQLVSFFAMIPKNKELEKELLLLSSNVKSYARKLKVFGGKNRNHYPELPGVLTAYCLLFESIDGALVRGITTDEGILAARNPDSISKAA